MQDSMSPEPNGQHECTKLASLMLELKDLFPRWLFK